jgi:hypothetical protein
LVGNRIFFFPNSLYFAIRDEFLCALFVFNTVLYENFDLPLSFSSMLNAGFVLNWIVGHPRKPGVAPMNSEIGKSNASTKIWAIASDLAMEP